MTGDLGVRGRAPHQVGQLPRRLVRRVPRGPGRAGRAPVAGSDRRGAVRRDGAVRGARARARLDLALRRPDRAGPRRDRQPRPGLRAVGDLRAAGTGTWPWWRGRTPSSRASRRRSGDRTSPPTPASPAAESRRRPAHADALDEIIGTWCADPLPGRRRGGRAAPRVRGGPGHERPRPVRGSALPCARERRGAGRPGVRAAWWTTGRRRSSRPRPPATSGRDGP